MRVRINCEKPRILAHNEYRLMTREESEAWYTPGYFARAKADEQAAKKQANSTLAA
jgi:hypothetical protein